LARLGKFVETSDSVTAAANTYIAAMMSYAANMKTFNWTRAYTKRDQYYERVRELPRFNSILSGVDFFRNKSMPHLHPQLNVVDPKSSRNNRIGATNQLHFSDTH
ncbi:hypothetical protein ACEQ6C_38225, partial [Rhizobium ruizarguesonis]